MTDPLADLLLAQAVAPNIAGFLDPHEADAYLKGSRAWADAEAAVVRAEAAGD